MGPKILSCIWIYKKTKISFCPRAQWYFEPALPEVIKRTFYSNTYHKDRNSLALWQHLHHQIHHSEECRSLWTSQGPKNVLNISNTSVWLQSEPSNKKTLQPKRNLTLDGSWASMSTPVAASPGKDFVSWVWRGASTITAGEGKEAEDGRIASLMTPASIIFLSQFYRQEFIITLFEIYCKRPLWKSCKTLTCASRKKKQLKCIKIELKLNMDFSRSAASIDHNSQGIVSSSFSKILIKP